MLVHLKSPGKVNVVRSGPQGKPPLVLIHPVSMDASWWGDQFKEFSKERDVIAIDLPGHGLSEQPNCAITFELMCDAVEGVLEQMGVAAVDLVGISVGGMIAQCFVLRRPDLVRSLTLVSTLCTFPENVRQLLRDRACVARTQGMTRIAELSIERWFTPEFRRLRPDVITRAEIGLLRQSGEYHARMWEMIAELDFENRLSTLRCPTLVITGTEDINAPPAAAEQIGRAIPGAVVRLLPALGHFPPFEDPEGFNTILREFMQSL